MMGLFRKKLRVIDRREMNEDWRVGDLAECTIGKHGWRFVPYGHPAPIRGHTYLVTEIGEGVALNGVMIVGLRLEGITGCWQCTCFRKLRPSIEPCEAEFAASLRNRLSRTAPVGA